VPDKTELMEIAFNFKKLDTLTDYMTALGTSTIFFLFTVKKYRSLVKRLIVKVCQFYWAYNYDKWLPDEAMLRLTIPLLTDPEDRSG